MTRKNDRAYRWKFHLGMTVATTAVVASLVMAAGASAQSDRRIASATAPANAEVVLPQPGEIRLKLTLGGREVSFIGPMDPVVRETVPFAMGEYTMERETREAAARIHAQLIQSGNARTLPGNGGSQKALIVVAYHMDETIAYRRARAIRGEMIERFQMDPGAILAAGRLAPEHSSGTTVTDIYAVNPSSCAGCTASAFRPLAYDSGTVKLVMMLPEVLSDQTALVTPSAKPAVDVATSAATNKKATVLPVPQPAKVVTLATKPVPTAAKGLTKGTFGKDSVVRTRSVKLGTGKLALLGQACPRPRIIMDDYYPGGPIVPCAARVRR